MRGLTKEKRGEDAMSRSDKGREFQISRLIRGAFPYPKISRISEIPKNVSGIYGFPDRFVRDFRILRDFQSSKSFEND